MKNTLRALALPLVVAMAASAQAAPVRVDLSVVGLPGSGYFVYESTAGTPGPFGETEYALVDFSFDLGGHHYGPGDLFGGAGLAIFDGSTLRGLEAVAGDGSFSFLPGTAFTAPFLVAGGRSADLLFRTGGQGVPLPGSLWLALAALPAWAAARRRRG